MATNDYTEATPEQMKVALEQIANMADSLRNLCMDITQNGSGRNAHISVAAGHLAARIGYMADRCLGFDGFDPDHFLLPPSWNRESEAHHA